MGTQFLSRRIMRIAGIDDNIWAFECTEHSNKSLGFPGSIYRFTNESHHCATRGASIARANLAQAVAIARTGRRPKFALEE